MSRVYPNGMLEWVRENYLFFTLPELTELCNEKFGTNMSAKAMSSMKKRYGMTGAPRVTVYSKTFPKEVAVFIAKNHKGTGHKKMAELIKAEFGIEYTTLQIKTYYHNHDLNSGLTGYFEKGHPAHNKGVKMSPEVYEKAKATMFKPGNRPHNTNKVGDIVQTSDGYHKIKVAEPNVWEFCHIKAWKEAHGEIPDGMLVSFKDGNKSNWGAENLMLITQGENSVMNHMKLRFDRAEATESGLLIAKLYQATKKRRKENVC